PTVGFRIRRAIIPERDVPEGYPPFDLIVTERDRARLVPERDRQIQVFEDPVEEREGAVDLDLDVHQLPEREEDAALLRGEGNDRADGHRAAIDDLPPRDQVDERGSNREEGADDHEE